MPAPPRDGLHSLGQCFSEHRYRLSKGSTSEFGIAVSKDETSNELARNSKLQFNGGTAFSLLDPRKRIAFEMAIEAERWRGAETAVIRVQGRVALFTTRRTDTAVMVVRHRNTSGPDANRRADETAIFCG